MVRWRAPNKTGAGEAKGVWGNSPALDQLRFLVALLVIVFHFRDFETVPEGLSGVTRFTYVWLRWGQVGVSVFLVLSAFLFTMNSDLGSKKVDYWPFIRKRLLRIAPIYLLVGILLMTQKRAQWSVLDFLTFATFQVNGGPPYAGYGNDALPIGPIWTIGVEFQFYLLFPFLIAALPPTGWRNCSRLLGIIGIMIAFRFLMQCWSGAAAVYWESYFTLLGRFDQFLIGMLAAAFYVKFRTRITPLVGCVALAGAFTLATLLLYKIKQHGHPNLMFSFPVEGLIGAVVVIGMLASGGAPGWIGRLLAVLGKASYSMYLLHFPIGTFLMAKYGGFNEGVFALHWMKVICLVLTPTIMISIACYHCIEKPFIDLGKAGPNDTPAKPV